MKITHDAQVVIDAARILGGKAYIVGGAVRDFLLGIESKDIDIEVHGLADLTSLSAILKTFGRVDEVGVSFGVLKFGHDVDVSLPRRDSKVSEGHRGFEITVDPTLTLTEALSRRDFTINSMAFDPETGGIIDPFGGQIDLEIHVLRHTSAAFSEDPLRVLRGIQFAARFGLEVAPETAELCQSLVWKFGELATERVWGEFEKVLTKGMFFGSFFDALLDTGWIVHFPELETAKGADDTLASWLMLMPTVERIPFCERLGVPHDIRRQAIKLAEGALYITAVPEPTHADAHWVARHIAPATMTEVCYLVKDHVKALAFGRVALAAKCYSVPVPALLDGHALMELGMEPGPQFGKILKRALELQDRGEFSTREEAMQMVQAGKFG